MKQNLIERQGYSERIERMLQNDSILLKTTIFLLMKFRKFKTLRKLFLVCSQTVRVR